MEFLLWALVIDIHFSSLPVFHYVSFIFFSFSLIIQIYVVYSTLCSSLFHLYL